MQQAAPRAPNHFVAPTQGAGGRMLQRIANCARVRALRRALLAHVPFPVLASDVRDVVYAHWRIPAARAAALVSPGIALVQQDGWTVLTVLTYRHGHFGPALAGPLRRLFPSPLQSNWRLYVDSAASAVPVAPGTVLFLRNVFDNALYALGTRLFSDALPSHLAGSFRHDRMADGWEIRIAGPGSAPELRLTVHEDAPRVLPPDFAALFGSWDAAVRTLSLQDAAVVAVEDAARLAEARISLPIDRETIAPLATGRFDAGGLLAELGATAPPFCFRVPAVHFRVLSERLLPGQVPDIGGA
ncbi:hypothetical protein AB2M62_18895 [Sphingomonas sp. MMS12-HWE2-04]|uniref:hypothetical protein n=1 Tax=Sphingomonas sp. MMS12-HWE2-04 TaxID=3234199 RepID=UPI00384B69AE